MAPRGQPLADKLLRILQIAQQNCDKRVTSEALAALVAEERLREFAYFYRRIDGKIAQGFSSALRVRSYIAFLEFAELLDEECRPLLEIRVDDNGWIANETLWNLADRAKEVLSREQLGVDRIETAAMQLLHGDSHLLPTVERIYEALESPIDRQYFKWLLALYALHPAALVKWRQATLLLPRDYTRSFAVGGGTHGPSL